MSWRNYDIWHTCSFISFTIECKNGRGPLESIWAINHFIGNFGRCVLHYSSCVSVSLRFWVFLQGERESRSPRLATALFSDCLERQRWWKSNFSDQSLHLLPSQVCKSIYVRISFNVVPAEWPQLGMAIWLLSEAVAMWNRTCAFDQTSAFLWFTDPRSSQMWRFGCKVTSFVTVVTVTTTLFPPK